jgi:hypothetical protein
LLHFLAVSIVLVNQALFQNPQEFFALPIETRSCVRRLLLQLLCASADMLPHRAREVL